MAIKRRTLLGAAGGMAAAASLPRPAISAGGTSVGASVLKFIPQANLTILDPITTTAAVTQNHCYYVWDTLYAVDEHLVPHPQMAAGHSVSSDQRTWTITLRDGLKFHDGAPVRAADCIASVKRWASVDPFGEDLAEAVDSYVAKSDKSFDIRLKTPFPLLDAALAKPAANVPVIMPEHIAAQPAAKAITIDQVIGSGPCRFEAKEYVSGSRVVYSKFADYVPRPEKSSWASGGKIVNFDRIEWHVIPDPGTAVAALQSGEVDWWELVLPNLIPLLATNKDIVIGAGNPTGYLGCLRFNSLFPPFDNVLMRQAVMMAVDQSAYMRAVTANNPKNFEICHSFFPLGTTYGIPPNPDPMAKGPDLGEAKKLIEAAKYAGQKIVIINPTDFPSIQPFGEITYATLKKLGLNVDLVETDWGTVVQRRASKAPVDKGGWTIFHTWWLGVSLYNPAVNPIILGQGLKGWFGWYQSDEMMALNNDWLTANGADARQAVAAKMQALAFHDVPTVPLGQFYIRTAYRSTLSGVSIGASPYPWNVRRA